MKNKILQIINDIIEENKELRGREKELEKIIKDLMQLKPKSEIDQDFYLELKEKIRNKIKPKESIFSKIWKFKYSLASLIVFFIFTMIGLNLHKISQNFSDTDKEIKEEYNAIQNNKNEKQINNNMKQDLKYSITENKKTQKEHSIELKRQEDIKKKDNKKNQKENNIELKRQEDIKEKDNKKNQILGLGGGLDKKSSQSNLMTINYNYQYTGKKIKIPGNMKVYKQDKKGKIIDNYGEIIKNTNIKNINLENFEKLGISNISFKENKKNGYKIFINSELGELNILPGDDWKFENNSNLKNNKIPENKKILKKAKNFIENNGIKINKQKYGNMQINNERKQYYEKSENKKNFNIPKGIRIIIPIIINNYKVYNIDGSLEGININYNIQNNKISSLGPIKNINLSKSNYKTEQNIAKIINLYNEQKNKNNKKIKNKFLTLTNAKLVYSKNYIKNNGKDEIYYVPSLLFNIKTNINKHPNKIVIPIIKKFMK